MFPSARWLLPSAGFGRRSLRRPETESRKRDPGAGTLRRRHRLVGLLRATLRNGRRLCTRRRVDTSHQSRLRSPPVGLIRCGSKVIFIYCRLLRAPLGPVSRLLSTCPSVTGARDVSPPVPSPPAPPPSVSLGDTVLITCCICLCLFMVATNRSQPAVLLPPPPAPIFVPTLLSPLSLSPSSPVH